MMILFTLTWILGIWASNVVADDKLNYRLPNTVIPERYTLEIITDLRHFNFSGEVWITVKCIQETNQVFLHSKDLSLSINRTTVNKKNSLTSELKPTNFSFFAENDFFIITLNKFLTVNERYEIFIPFNGTLDESLEGYYRSSYHNLNTNSTEWLSVTQFEPTSARKAFPCFDEPAMKAIFNISLGRTKNYTSISNMPISKTEPIKGRTGWEWDRYQETVPISTYLIAYVVSDFDYKQAPPTKNNVEFKIWARHNAISQVEFSKQVGPKCLEFYESFFYVKYPLPKQDMIAIPDFNAGAMENWGLITYREALLLFDNSTSSEINKYSIASIIAHELAHQWFGNLVTIKWWTDVWLNEGFATHMASLAVENLFPQWNSLSHETVYSLQSVFDLDSLMSSHPVSVPIGNPKEIYEIFDTISYWKGSFLLHMIRHFLSEDTFKQGVTRYLNEHKYSNAEQDDLWQALTMQGREDNVLPRELTIKTIMDTWTLQTGYPLVTVTRNYQSKTATLYQERFVRDTIEDEDQKSCWWIPITYTTQTNLTFEDTLPKLWLQCPIETQYISHLPDEQSWILLNLNLSGLYRINYDEDNWKLLINTLKSDAHGVIPILNRVQLITDSAALAWVGKLSYEIHFNVLDYVQNEKDYLPWRSALSNIKSVEKLLRRTSAYGAFKGFMKKLLPPIYKEIGGFDVKPSKNMLESTRYRSLITSFGCTFDVDNCIKDAQDLFNKWLTNPDNNIIPKELRTVVYCTALKYGGEKEWNFLWNRYKVSNIATEKILLLSNLGCTREVWLLERYLGWAIEENSGIRRQDATDIFAAVASNEIGYFVAKDFLWKNVENIQNHLGMNSRRISRFIADIASQMILQEDYDELKHFTILNQGFLKTSKQAVQQALETVKLQVQWRKAHFRTIKNILSAYENN